MPPFRGTSFSSMNAFNRFILICQFITRHVCGTLIYNATLNRVCAVGTLEPIRKFDNDNNITWSA